MKEQRDEKWLDELISQTIDSGKPQFDPEKWQIQYPEEFQMLKLRAGQTSAARQPNIWRIIMKSPIAKFAAAAVIIIAVSFFLIERSPDNKIENHTISKPPKSPAKMLTLGSTTMAYRRGGMDAVEKQIEKALTMLGPRTTSIPLEDLL